MAHVCEICNKHTVSGMNVSHSHLKTKRTWKPNIKRVRAMFETGFIGEIITNSTVVSVKSAVQDTLIALVNNSYIMGYDSLSVEIDDAVATQINIGFRYIPVYGMNYIQISFAINTATGSSVASSGSVY